MPDLNNRWWEQAACLGYPEVFEISHRTKKGMLHLREARELCDGCPVKRDCLKDVMRQGPSDGQFHLFQAGYTTDELHTLWNTLQGRKQKRSAA